MTENNLSHWLAASFLPGVSSSTVLKWLDVINAADPYSAITTLSDFSIDGLLALGFTRKHIAAIQTSTVEAVAKALAWQEHPDHHLLALGDENYPPLLKQISDPPLVLYVHGNLAALTCDQIAFVGARNATFSGLKNADHFARALVSAGYVITSGLAAGIDGAAHQGALTAKGLTIGVAGTGLHYVYPKHHRKLVEDVIQNQGAVISEFALNTPPLASNFPRRNRIISGLSRGVLVVEAAIKSGSLITARHSLMQNREVFAIPGSIHQPLSRGCHYLIQQGAKLVEKVEDILEELGQPIRCAPISHKTHATVSTDLTRPELSVTDQRLLAQIEYEITPLDVILLRSGFSAGDALSILMTLELKGYLASVPGGYCKIKSN